MVCHPLSVQSSNKQARLSRVCHNLAFPTTFLANHHAHLRSSHPAIPNSLVSFKQVPFSSASPFLCILCSFKQECLFCLEKSLLSLLYLENSCSGFKMHLRCDFHWDHLGSHEKVSFSLFFALYSIALRHSFISI